MTHSCRLVTPMLRPQSICDSVAACAVGYGCLVMFWMTWTYYGLQTGKV
jgi:hypothetical protein